MSLTALQEQTVYNALIHGKYPVKTVQMAGVTCEFTFSLQEIPTTVPELFEYSQKVIRLIGVTDDRVSISSDLPYAFFLEIIRKYVAFQRATYDNLLELQQEFLDTPNSRHIWKMLKIVGAAGVFTAPETPLNMYQQRWIMCNLHLDEKDKWEMIQHVFEAAQPWMNPEMYSKVQKRKKDTRTNWKYNDEEFDQKMQERAMAAVAAKNKGKRRKARQVVRQSFDEITIEGKK